MNKTQIAQDQLSDALVNLTDQLGYGAEKLWTLYVQAQQAQAISNSLTLGVALAGAGLGAYVSNKLAIKYNEIREEEVEGERYRSHDAGDKMFAKGAAITMGVFIGGMFGMMLGDFIATEIVMKAIAPEYTAAQELIGQLRSLV